MNSLPRGIMGGLDWAGVPRPSGAGSTREPIPSSGAGAAAGAGGRLGSQTAHRTPWLLSARRLLRPPAAMPRAVPAADQPGTVCEDG